jgi:hypothetical protein
MNAAVLAVAADEPVFVTLPLLVDVFAAAPEPCVAWFRDAHQFETLLMLPIDMDHLLAWFERLRMHRLCQGRTCGDVGIGDAISPAESTQ